MRDIDLDLESAYVMGVCAGMVAAIAAGLLCLWLAEAWGLIDIGRKHNARVTVIHGGHDVQKADVPKAEP